MAAAIQQQERSSSRHIHRLQKNKSLYTDRDVARAHKARKFQEIVGASLRRMLHVIDRKLLPNCPITRADIKMAEHIFGPSTAHSKGKTVGRSTDHII